MTWIYFSILVAYDKLACEIPSAESLIDRIMLSLKKFAQGTPLKGIRSDLFHTIKKESFNDVTTDDNVSYLNSRSSKRVYTVETFTDGERQNLNIIHQSNNDTYFYKSWNGRIYEIVNFSEKDVYTIERYYRQIKSKDWKEWLLESKYNSSNLYITYIGVIYSNKLLDFWWYESSSPWEC